MKKYIVFFFLIFVFFSCKKDNENYKIASQKIDWEQAKNYYKENIASATVLLDSLARIGANHKNTIQLFDDLRLSFKKAEAFAGALNAEITHRANGPALPIYNDDSGRVIEAVGLQKLEETLYEEPENEIAFKRDLYMLKGFFELLQKSITKRDLTPQRFFVGTHQQLMRITSLSLAGFDTPVTGKSIKESTTSLASLQKVYELSIQETIKNKDPDLNQLFIGNVSKAIQFINENSDFETFDRFTFIKDYLNPITRNWVAIRKTVDVWQPDSRFFAYNFDAPTFFETNSFNINHFLTSNTKNASKEIIDLGEKLFFEKKLSKNKTLACVTCHNPKKAYSDGLKVSLDNNGSNLQRNSPTLLNASYQKSFFWDGRAGTLESQISLVFNNSSEFNSNVHEFSKEILEDSIYVPLFKKAFGNIPKSNKQTITAISAYIATLKSFNSKFDKNIRGEENTFSSSEKRGFNLYMGKALCATCHFIPLTNGTVPPYFTESEKEVIGVPKTATNKEVDEDKGFYWVFEENLHDKMFKTPTVRNADITAPYMHNGVYNTLEEVMDFYNKGGGAGLGFNLPYQTLPFDNLNLSEQEITDIIAFIKTLTNK